jgi:hypothetical protein
MTKNSPQLKLRVMRTKINRVPEGRKNHSRGNFLPPLRGLKLYLCGKPAVETAGYGSFNQHWDKAPNW